VNPPTTISGKDHPDLIDDATAYWHLFRILSRSDGEAFEVFQRRRLAFAITTNLTKEQIQILLRAADTFAAQMAYFASQPATPGVLEARTNTVLSIVGTLRRDLGEQGALVLTNYVNGQFKRNIVLITTGH
jgi:hypothetical protein